MATQTVVVADDDPHVVAILDEALTQAGYLVLRASDGQAALELAVRQHPDVIITDVAMPRIDGIDLCRRLRQDPATAAMPIVMLTAKGEVGDKVLGLEMGADDYVVKPFEVPEILARVKALLRRAGGAFGPEPVVRSGEVAIDLPRRRVTCGGHELCLTFTEFNLLLALARHPGRVLSREQLLEGSHEGDYAVTDRAIDVHVVALRRKLGKTGARIETVRGVGYRLREE